MTEESVKIIELEKRVSALELQLDAVKIYTYIPKKEKKHIYKAGVDTKTAGKKYRSDTKTADILRAIGDYMVIVKPEINSAGYWLMPRAGVYKCYKNRFGFDLKPTVLSALLQGMASSKKMVIVLASDHGRLAVYENGTARICDLLGLDFGVYFKSSPEPDAAPDAVDDIII